VYIQHGERVFCEIPFRDWRKSSTIAKVCVHIVPNVITKCGRLLVPYRFLRITKVERMQYMAVIKLDPTYINCHDVLFVQHLPKMKTLHVYNGIYCA